MIQRGTTSTSMNLSHQHVAPSLQNEQTGASISKNHFQRGHNDKSSPRLSHNQFQLDRGDPSSPRVGHNNHHQLSIPTSSMPPKHPGNQEANTFTHHCSICNVSCNHEVAYKQHLNGKKHQKKAAQLGADISQSNLALLPLTTTRNGSTGTMHMAQNGFAHLTKPLNETLGFTTQLPATAPVMRNVDRQSAHGVLEARPLNQVQLPRNNAYDQLMLPSESAKQNDQRQHQYFCAACGVTCNHELAYKQHLDGKRHKKQVARLGNAAQLFGSPAVPAINQQPPIFHAGPFINQQPPIVHAVPLVSDPRLKVAPTISKPAVAPIILQPDSTTQSPKEDILVSHNDNDSEEEGEIDEATEDIQHLYNDFEEPKSAANEVNDSTIMHRECTKDNADDSKVDSDIDEMFGEDAETAKVDEDIEDMFGEDVIASKPNLLHSQVHRNDSQVNDNDEMDMFGESNDETEVQVEEQNKQDDGSKQKRKRVSFCIQPMSEKKVTLGVPLTASDALAAARVRASIPKAKELQGVANRTSLSKNIPPASTSTKHQNTPKSLLKSLLKRPTSAPKLQKTSDSSSIISQQASDIPKRSYYQHVHPDKYWSTLRNWDFVRELNDAMKQAQHPLNNNNRKGKKRPMDEVISEKSTTNNTLPDSFDSVDHYKAMWAPMLIEEAKAQLLSEVVSAQSSSASSIKDKSRLFMGVVAKIELSRSAKDLSIQDGSAPIEQTAVLQIRPIARGARIECGVLPNDLLLFVRDLSVIEHALRGMALNDNSGPEGILGNLSKGRLGFIGQALNRRSEGRSADGMQARVSQKIWNQFSSLDSMLVIRLGSTVTALREWHALVKLHEVPLSNYLLDGKVDVECGPYQSTNSDPLSQADNAGLPVGFRIYVKAKMNTSQLQAITASVTEYGSGGFTLIKGPPGTGKSTTLISILNALHLRQYQKYYEAIESIITESKASTHYEEIALLNRANEMKPRILVCAPSNAAVDNVAIKLINDRFVDGNGTKYNPSIVRVGAGIVSDVVKKISLQVAVNSCIEQGADPLRLESLIDNGRKELKRLLREVQKLKTRIQALVEASPYTISEDWEIRIMEGREDSFRILFVNHKTKTTTFDIPPKVRPTEKALDIKQLPHYVALLKNLTKYVERHNTEASTLEKYVIINNHANLKQERRRGDESSSSLYQELETHLLNSTHIVLTTLGSAGSRAIELANKFEVIIIDEAAQSSEMSTLTALQLGSSHAILVGDPQQLPATVFSMSGRSSKYDRSLFARLEQCKHPVVMLNVQYRMHPMISEFPRHIFYEGALLDAPNTLRSNFGSDLKVYKSFPHFKPLTILDLNSKEERDGTSLSNMNEAKLTVHLYLSLERSTQGSISKDRVAIITPYTQQTLLLHKLFEEALGSSYSTRVEISTVDAFQGRESGVVIYSCVRAGGKGIGFLSDVQRMNVALTRAKFYLFVIARRRSIMMNPYWRQLVGFARQKRSLIHVPIDHRNGLFPELSQLVPIISDDYSSESEYSA